MSFLVYVYIFRIFVSMIKKTAEQDRLWQQRINTDGDLFVVVSSPNVRETLVCFSDGTELTCNFSQVVRGTIINKNKYNVRLWEQKNNNSGELMVIVDIITPNTVSVLFSDGTLVESTYTYFTKGVIKNPSIYSNRLWEQSMSKAGELMVITKIITAKIIEVCFSDGTTTMCDYSKFKTGCVKNKNKYAKDILFEQNYNNDGELMVIVEAENSRNVGVLFVDGTITYGSCRGFRFGEIRNPNSLFNSNIWIQNRNNSDELMVIVHVENSSKVHACFSDGEIVICALYDFKLGKVSNPNTTNRISKTEIELYDFLSEHITHKIERANKYVLGGKHLDIFIPELKVGFEMNGMYWHSEFFKYTNYHLDKTLGCNEKGVRLIHIFEDEWIFNNEITKSRIKNILGLTTNKIYARKTTLKEIDSTESNAFLVANHLQGKVNASVRLGLFYENELVSVMLFNKPRLGIGGKYDGYELSRFASKLNTNVIGGANKLLKYFEKTYEPKQIISYADIRWSDGDLYRKLGFVETHRNPPNYSYTLNQKRKHRFGFRKSILEKEGFDTKNKTEHQIMLDRKIYRIYDCGTISFKKLA